MVEFGTEVEIDDNQRKEIFVSVQNYVFSAEDKQAYMLQFTEEEKMVWLKGVQINATKLVRYDIPAEARFFSSEECIRSSVERRRVPRELGFSRNTQQMRNEYVSSCIFWNWIISDYFG